MRCDYNRNSRNPCLDEAVGMSTDRFGSNYYCEKHLAELEAMVLKASPKTYTGSIKITRFKTSLGVIK